MEDKILIVVDMQVDFINGALGTKEAEAIVPGVIDFINEFRASGGEVVYTKDMHNPNTYLKSREGKHLPVKHCLEGDFGSNIFPAIEMNDEAATRSHKESNGDYDGVIYPKSSFGSIVLFDDLACVEYSEIHLVGLCTDICVISNAVLAQTAVPEAEIYIHKDLCAGTTPEAHERALKCMEGLQMNII